MRFDGEFLYRVRVSRYPDGAFEPITAIDPDFPEDAIWSPVPGWRPPGWRPAGNYTQIMGTDEFVWPVTNKVYRTYRTAQKRVNLLESYGARAVVERSSRITWPEPDQLGGAV
ncbi:hypothetical protein [Mycobacteroides sp. PCS013]|uniref:hypothetical protein n=1 Tax=Mycobacteroides sp. PCS013 TaxID=3074106 RepID=UPI003C2CBD41